MAYRINCKDMGFTRSQEFLALENDAKPAIRFSISENQKSCMDKIKNKIKKSGLTFLIKSYKEIHKIGSENIDYLVYAAKSKNLAEELLEAEKKNDTRKIGEILGYPDCCIDFYIDIRKTSVGKDDMFCVKSFLNTKSKPNFHVNNTFNFQSRIGGQLEKLRSIRNRNFNKTNYTNYFLISHAPCSYDCKKSIKMGREMLRILKVELPEFANEIVSALKNPFLVFDDFNWIIFDGTVKNRRVIEYDNIYPVRSLYPDNVFRNGNGVKVSGDVIEILKDNEIIQTIKKKNEQDGVIIDFS